MIFKRRDSLPFFGRLKELFSPRKGWRRGFEYVKHRIRRLPDTPHRIALGFACGSFVSFSPFYTLHIPITLFFAWSLRANYLSAFIGTFVGNGLSTPFIAVAAIAVGQAMLGRPVNIANFSEIAHAFGEAFRGLWQIAESVFGYGDAAPERLLPFFQEIFLPYMVGGALLGLVAAVVGYVAARSVVAAHQRRRQARLLRLAGRKRPVAGGSEPAG